MVDQPEAARGWGQDIPGEGFGPSLLLGGGLMSQKQRVLNALKMQPVCGTSFLDWHIPRYAARIWELRAEGYEIASRPCRLHSHESPQTVYELAESDQLRLSV